MLSYLEESMYAHSIEWGVVFAYFDETGMHGDAAPITAVAGYVFCKKGAELFNKMFQENITPLLPLDKNGNKMYHSKSCIPTPPRDYFKDVPQNVRERIVELLVDTIKKSVTLGVVIAIRREDYEEAIAAAPKLRELAGSKYSVCLLRCIEYVSAWLDHEQMSGRVEYLFEDGCTDQIEAEAILKNISASNELMRRYRWRGRSFVVKSTNDPQLFASDLLAWEWQRAHINAMDSRHTEWRPTLEKLVDGTPHIPRYETPTSVGIRAIVNSFYGLTGGAHVKE